MHNAAARKNPAAVATRIDNRKPYPPGTRQRPFFTQPPSHTAKAELMTSPTSARFTADHRNASASQQSHGPHGQAQDGNVAPSGPRLRSGDRMPQYGAGPAPMPEANEQLLTALRGQIDAISPPYTGRVDALVAVFKTLKDGETEIWHSLKHYPDHPAVTRCKGSLHRLLGHFASTLQASTNGGITGKASLEPAQIQTICQGLAVCVPSSGSLLVRDDHESCKALQCLTHSLLAQAMASGLIDVARANGELLDVLNWLSRGLKAGLLTAGIPIRQCFEHSLLPIHDWTGGNQSRGVLTDHNLGRCAVQISTVLCLTGIDFAAPFRPGVAGTPAMSEQAQRAVLTNGQQVQRCVLQLCAPAVLERLARTPADIIALVNISNMIKYAIEKHLIAVHEPLLVPALGKLVDIIGALPDAELVGRRADCRPLANFSNLLRLLYEHRAPRHEAMAEPFPGLDLSCSRLVDCINSRAFERSHQESQALSNLISFVKLCDKKLAPRTAAVGAATSTTSTATTSLTAAPLLGQDMLHDAARRLVAGVLRYGAAAYSGAPALAGLLSGLLYLYRRNLVTRTPELTVLIKGLLARVGQTNASAWRAKDRKTMLPVLKGLLQFDMVSVDDAQAALSRLLPASGNGAAPRTLRDVVDEIERLGIVDEVVISLSVAVHLPVAAPVSPAPIRGRPSSPPGWTPIAERPSASSTPLRAESPAYAGRNIKADNPAWREVDSRKRIASPLSSAKMSSASMQPNMGAHTVEAQGFSGGMASNLLSPGVLPQQTVADKEPAVPVRGDKTDAHASGGNKKKKSKQAGKKNAPAKAGARPGANSTNKREVKLKQAILAGKVQDVKQLFLQKPNWMNTEIHGVLDAVIDEIELINTPVLDALDAFFTVIKETYPATGTTLLTNYFLFNGHVFAGLKALADRHGLTAGVVRQAGMIGPDLEFMRANRVAMTDKPVRHYRNDKSPTIVSFTGSGQTQESDASPITQVEFALNDALFQDQVVRLSANINGVTSVQEIMPNYASAIAYAAQEGDIDRVRRLLQLQSPAVHVVEGFTPLILAVRRRHMDIVRLLLQSEPLLEQLAAKDNAGLNALMWAADTGSEKSVELLLAAGTASSQTTDVDNEGWNAMFYAAQKGRVGILRQLLNADHDGKQLSAKLPGGANAMMVAAEYGHTAVISALLATPSGEAQLTHTDNRGNNAMFMAINGVQAKVIKLLLKTRTGREQASTSNINEFNTLAHAAALGHTALVRLFLETEFADALASRVLTQKANALILAAQNGHTDIVKLLLEMKSGDLQCKDVSYDGKNALMLAACNGHEDIVRQLLSRRHAHEQAAAVDALGMNALDYARTDHHLAVVKLLEDVALPVAPEAMPADPARHEKPAV